MEKLNSTDFDIENLFGKNPHAKPLTKGLGFETQISLKEKSQLLKADLLKTQKFNIEVPNEKLSMGDLSPFYSGELNQEEAIFKPIESIALESNLVRTTWDKRILAYSIDLLSIVALFGAVILIGYLFSGLSLNQISAFKLEFLLYTLPLGLLIYLFYFSFLDKTKNSTIGKQIAGIRVVSLKDSDPMFMNTFFRSLISLASILTFGLTIFLDFHGKISETKVVAK